MGYKNYNVFSEDLKVKIKESNNYSGDALKINKLLHYTKKVQVKTIAQALKAGATPNKWMFDAIQKYYQGEKVSIEEK